MSKNKDEKKHINKLTKTFMKKNGIGYNKAHKWAVKFVTRKKKRRYK